ncbi:MAG: hypothetical protein K0S76_2671 [Herbinix sp.]|jgi:uncharacterized membrane protein required for colicin V production|nr:hypothetical protein [Herbinix sp.]
MNWLLVVVLAILIGNALVGLKVGFIKTVFSLVSMIIAITLTVWLSPSVEDFLKGNEKFNHYITSKVEEIVQPEVEENKEETKEKIIETLPLPKSIKDGILKNGDSVIDKVVSTDQLTNYIVEYLVNLIINALSFILTFVVILILLWVLCFALNLVSKLPILNSVNKTAGLLAGLLHGLIIVWIFFILLTVFGGTGFGQDTLKMIGEDEILSFLYNNNLLIRFITSAIKIIF